MKFNTVERTCPMCGKYAHMYLSEKNFEAYMNYSMYRRKLIQEALPDLDAPSREFLKTGYCRKCMKTLFGKTTDRIMDGPEGFLEGFGLDEREFESLDDLCALETEFTQLADSVAPLHKDDRYFFAMRSDENQHEGSYPELASSEHFIAYKEA